MTIFIDCTLVDFSRQPTGIPRVVLNYINVGYEWAKRSKVDVIPCVPAKEGVYIVRPIPGKQPPKDLRDRVKVSEIRARRPGHIKATEIVISYVAGVISALTRVLSALLPTQNSKAIQNSFDKFLGRTATSLGRNWDQKAQGQILLKPGRGDIVFCPAYWHDVDPDIYRNLKESGARIVLLVHDILPISFDKYYPAPWKYEFKERVVDTTTYVDALFCVSNYTRDSLKEFLTRQKVRLPEMRTAYNGFEPLVSQEGLDIINSKNSQPHFGNAKLAKIARERHPYVMVGSVEPKKGHIPTVQCFEMMWNAGLERDLVIVGRKGWMDAEITRTIEESSYYGKKLFWFSNIDDFDLADLYIHCRALIFASVSEGFGIPLIEAAHYGRPAIVFDSAIAREVIGDFGYFFDEATGFIEHVITFEDELRYIEVLEKLSHFKWHSWEEYSPSIFDSLLQLAKKAS